MADEYERQAREAAREYALAAVRIALSSSCKPGELVAAAEDVVRAVHYRLADLDEVVIAARRTEREQGAAEMRERAVTEVADAIETHVGHAFTNDALGWLTSVRDNIRALPLTAGEQRGEPLNHAASCPRHDGLLCNCPKGDERIRRGGTP